MRCIFFAMSLFLVPVLLAIVVPDFSSACNGYEFKLIQFKHCDDGANDVIKFTNPSGSLDGDCNIIPSGCVKTEGFTTAKIHYRLEKKPMPVLEGDYDLCKGAENKDDYSTILLGMLGLPSSCPVAKYENCGNGSATANVNKFKNKLGLALGTSAANFTITHDTGTTCLTMKQQFKRAKKLGK